MPTIIIFILVLLLVVVVHEAGHFFAAKQMGMRVKEFAFGFPPRLFSYKKGETRYSFNAIPLGGYVSIDGENGDINEAQDPKIFTNKSKLAQAWVLFAGPLMNIILAFVLLSISFMVGYGNTSNSDKIVILGVEQDSPAFVSGIKPGDKISAILEIENPNIDQFRESINTNKESPISITVERSNETKTIQVLPQKNGEDYRIGVSIGKLENKKLGLWESLVQSFKTTTGITIGTVKGFIQIIGNLITGGDVKASLTGPIGIAKEVGTASSFGFAYLLSFIAIISINLGVLNLFPFPALDGGRLLFLLIEKIKGSKINPKTANIVNLSGFGLLILLMIFITIRDIIKFF